MTQDNQQFLVGAGFTPSDTGELQRPINFDASAGIVLVDASPLSVVEVAGEDAVDFFQAQTCNDLALLAMGQAQLNGYCNPKGRLLAHFTVVKVDAGFLLVMPAEVVAGFIKRLTMFVMRAKVAIRERPDLQLAGLMVQQSLLSAADSDQFHLGELCLPGSAMLTVAGSTTPDQEHIRIAYPTHHESSRARYLLIGTVENLKSDWTAAQNALGDGASTLAGYDTWRAADITACRGSVVAGTRESFIPQMLNMQLTDGLSFKKGCYPGQEIVARMHYLGKLKRQMRWFSAELKAPPLPGASLISGDDADAGVVVDAVVRSVSVESGVYKTDAGNQTMVDVLAVVKIDKPLDSFNYAGATLVAESIPYELNLPE